LAFLTEKGITSLNWAILACCFMLTAGR